MEEIIAIAHNSEDYREMIKLRHKILYAPWGLNFTPEQLDKETNDFHIVYKKSDRILGCLVATIRSPTTVQFRQVAVDESVQRQGVGKRIVKFAENLVFEKGFKKIEIESRETAIAFYEKLDYTREGERFFKVGLPHFKVTKVIK